MSRPLNIRYIEVFRAVMLSGTTTGAAQLLNTTQPAVSRTLKQLQASSGLRLFELQRGRLTPTQDAKELFDVVSRHYLGLEKIEQTFDALSRGSLGMLQVACTPVLGASILPAILSEFRNNFPSMPVSLHTIETHVMRDGLLSGVYDLVLSTSSLNAIGLEPELLHQSESVCIMSKLHPLKAKKCIQVDDLKDYPLLTHHKGDTLQQRLTKIMSERGITPPSVIETNYSTTICGLAAADLGLGVISPYTALVNPDMVHIASFRPCIPVQAEMAFSPNIAPSRRAELFASSARRIFKALNQGVVGLD